MKSDTQSPIGSLQPQGPGSKLQQSKNPKDRCVHVVWDYAKKAHQCAKGCLTLEKCTKPCHNTEGSVWSFGGWERRTRAAEASAVIVRRFDGMEKRENAYGEESRDKNRLTWSGDFSIREQSAQLDVFVSKCLISQEVSYLDLLICPLYIHDIV